MLGNWVNSYLTEGESNMENFDLNKQLVISKKFNYLTYALMGIGLVTIIIGFFVNPVKTWANYLMNNYYFLSLAIGATFFVALQYITQTGWSSAFIRIPQAMGSVIPVIAVLMIPILVFGLPELYHWAHRDAAAHDPIIAHKMPYLNLPFFIARYIIFFAVWIFLTRYLKKLSLKETWQVDLNISRKVSSSLKCISLPLLLLFHSPLSTGSCR